MSKNKLAGIIIACSLAIIAAILLVRFEPWPQTPSAQTYTLTTSASPPGTGTVNPSSGEYESGEWVILTARPAHGYAFVRWDGATSAPSNIAMITMDSDKTVTAHFAAIPPEILTVHFIDVGQGDSILLDLGDAEMLIDGGDKSPGVVSYIDDYVDGALEVMVATHPHADHIGGLIAVLDVFEVNEIWLNGDTHTTQTYSQFMAAVNSERAEVVVARRGDVIQAGVLAFDVLHPVDNLSDEINNNSIVLSLSYGQVDFLFTGDAEEEAEGSMLTGGTVPDVEVLKVGHHGSRTASSTQFLSWADPQCAIYMAGEGNGYGHPHQEAVGNLCEVGAETYGTDVHGTIIVTTDGATYHVLPSNSIPPVDCTTCNLIISVDGQGATSPSVGTYAYGSGTQVTVAASPAPGWEFDHWSGTDNNAANPTTITMSSDRSVTAHFVRAPPEQYTLTITVSPSGSGIVYPSSGTFHAGTVVTCTAYPTSEWQFDHWSGDASGTSSSIVITMDSDKGVTAYFDQMTECMCYSYTYDRYIPCEQATAICWDGTCSVSQSRQGTCSWHGGVKEWIN